MKHNIIRLRCRGADLSDKLAQSLELARYDAETRSEFERLQRENPDARVMLPHELPTDAELAYVHAALDIACRGEVWA